MRASVYAFAVMLMFAPACAFADEVLPVFPIKMQFDFRKNNSAYRVNIRFENRENLAEIYCDDNLIGAAKIDLNAQLEADANIVGLDLETAEAIPKCSKEFELRIYVRDFDAPGADAVMFHNLTFSGGKLVAFGR